ncbi:MAG: AraC family transcriptional regulator [Ferruginibacter sp.]
MMILITKVPKHLPDDVREIIEKYTYPGSPAREFPKLLVISARPKFKKEILARLQEAGVTVSTNSKDILAKRIQFAVIDVIENAQQNPYNISVLIAEKMKLNYAYLSTIFSDVYNNTIESFIGHCKIAKAKKLLKTAMSIQDIAVLLQYSSPAHFSYRFKAITGITPTQYRQMKRKKL